MSYAIWPVILNGLVEQNGYIEEMADNLNSTSTKFDIGPPQVRRRSTGAPVLISLTILCTSTQVTTFKTFYKDTLLGGSQRFEWVQPVSKTPVIMLFETDSRPAIRPAGGVMYRVALSLMMFEDMPV